MGKFRFRKPRGAALAVWPLLLISLGAVFWLDRFSDENFAYWTLPNPLHKNDRLSLGVGHGQVYWAYGWPYVGEQSDGRPIVGIVDGGPGWQNDGDLPREGGTHSGRVVEGGVGGGFQFLDAHAALPRVVSPRLEVEDGPGFLIDSDDDGGVGRRTHLLAMRKRGEDAGLERRDGPEVWLGSELFGEFGEIGRASCRERVSPYV